MKKQPLTAYRRTKRYAVDPYTRTAWPIILVGYRYILVETGYFCPWLLFWDKLTQAYREMGGQKYWIVETEKEAKNAGRIFGDRDGKSARKESTKDSCRPLFGLN